MSLNPNIKKVLVIGSGPIIIGQAAEFDYAGTQACRVLREEGVEIILANSNPATIMTDKEIADKVYIEPLTLPVIKRIIETERPDGILSGLGGQTGLNLCMHLAKDGFLTEMGVQLLGSSPSAIDKSEDRQLFKEAMARINQPTIPSIIATNIDDAIKFAEEIGFPVIIRPAFTLGGTGGGIATDIPSLTQIARGGLEASPISQILVEKCISGWKEIEFEVMRDKLGNAISVCSMENFDPVGVHTGDSIVIAPAVTLADKEYQMLRRAALDIICELGVEGGCNCQFALEPNSFEYAVIEVNPRVSRSSALASKATGYPIAKVATKIALGYSLDEIPNAVTGNTFAAFEPALDYVAVKFPKFPFDKFVYANRKLGTQMQATGEVMAISSTFEDALVKAVSGNELGGNPWGRYEKMPMSELLENIKNQHDDRVFMLYEALTRGVSVDDLHEITTIDKWFLHKMKKMKFNAPPKTYKMVDTCAAEFAAKTPYFYSLPYDAENEALDFIQKTDKKRIVVLGSGPIRIGQGIEFDYACVHCVWSLKKMGYEVIVINNNPETVSTDFDIADRLYFEPLTMEYVMPIIQMEQPIGVICAFGGGTAVKLAPALSKAGVNIIGTSADSIDLCEDRERFDSLLQEIDVLRPAGKGVMTELEAQAAADELGFPVLMRPSYVIGGQNMIIAHEPDDITEYMQIILREKQESPVLIDKYLSGLEIEVDAICDGEGVLVPGIMEHIERTGVHSGDSIAVYPAPHIGEVMAQRVYELTRKICLEIKALGLVNIQYIITHGQIFVIEVNPRASRTVPYISKVTGINMCDLAVKTSLGESLPFYGIAETPAYVTVKVPVFSFEKLGGVDTQLGPEMKSTGEVLGIGHSLEDAIFKGLIGAGYKMIKEGGVFLTVRNSDKPEISSVARKFLNLGFDLYATAGTAKVLQQAGLDVTIVDKISQNSENNSATLLESGKIQYIISTSAKGRDPMLDEVKIRRKAVNLGVPCLTSIDTANALADSLVSKSTEKTMQLVELGDVI